MQRQNATGRRLAYLRSQRNWTQEILAARLQCRGYNISRQVVAKIELGLRGVSDIWLIGFQKAFDLPIIKFFPQEVQDADMDFAKPDLPKKSRRKCQKLTKRPKKG